MFETVDSSITANFKLTYRDGLGNEIISSTFPMTVADPKVDEDVACLNQQVIKED
jgi:hypothetical protein